MGDVQTMRYSLDEIIEGMHGMKAEFESDEMREHIINLTLEKHPNNISPENWAIMYACEIFKKVQINYYVYDQPMDVSYNEAGVIIKRRG